MSKVFNHEVHDNYAAFRLLQATAGGSLHPPPAFIRLPLTKMMGYIEAFSSGREPIRPKRAEIITSNT